MSPKTGAFADRFGDGHGHLIVATGLAAQQAADMIQVLHEIKTLLTHVRSGNRTAAFEDQARTFSLRMGINNSPAIFEPLNKLFADIVCHGFYWSLSTGSKPQRRGAMPTITGMPIFKA